MQLNYKGMAVARAGMIADISNKVVVSRAFKSIQALDNGRLAFGLGVWQDSTDQDCVSVPSIEAHASQLAGVAMATSEYENHWINGQRNYIGVVYTPPGPFGSYYEPNSMVNVCRRGRVWVYTEKPVNIGDAASVRYAASGDFKTLGAWSKGDAGTGSKPVTGAQFGSTSTVDQPFAILEIYLP